MTQPMSEQARLHQWLTRQAVPPTVYRLFIVVAVAVCGILYIQALPVARAADGTEGFTLLLSAEPLTAAVWVAVLTAVAVAVALAATAIGRPTAGVFVVAAGLAIAAAKGGSIDGWLRRADGTGLYGFFAAEMLAWTGLWVAVTLVVYQFNAFLQKLAPERAEGVAEGAASVPEPTWWGAADAMEGRSGVGAELLAAGTCIVIGSVGVAVLVRVPQWPQVVWGVGISYLIAGLVAHQVSPVRNPLLFVLSPLIAGLGWYVYIAMQGMDRTELLHHYFQGQFWPAGLALPVHYASAGVAGAMFGRAWSQGMLRQHWLGLE